MKKQILLPMILLTITLLFTCSILYAVSYLAVKEEHEVQSENANFVFVNQNTTSKTMQITNTTSATVTIKTLQIFQENVIYLKYLLMVTLWGEK